MNFVVGPKHKINAGTNHFPRDFGGGGEEDSKDNVLLMCDKNMYRVTEYEDAPNCEPKSRVKAHKRRNSWPLKKL